MTLTHVKMVHLKFIMSSVIGLFLMGCQTLATKEESAMIDFSQVKQVTSVPALDESIATLDMTEFARRH